MKIVKLILILIIGVISQYELSAQNDSLKVWTLNQCVEYAHENNIQVKQMSLMTESNKANLIQSKAELLPNLNASVSDRFSYGRAIDPYSNDFTEQNIQSLSASISSYATIFSGFRKFNTIKQNQYKLSSSLEELEEIKNSIALQVASAYLQILFDKELLDVSKRQLEISKEQESRTQILVNAGSLAKGNLLEIQAQLANEELSLINAENNLKTSYLNLTQLLELDSTGNFEIEVPEIEEPSAEIFIAHTDTIYEESIDLPRIKKEEFNLQSSESGLKIAKGGLYPTLYAQAGYGSGFSSAASKYDPITFQPLTYSYSDQFNDNLNFSFSIGLSIPIFNNLQVKTNITNSRLNVENSKYQLQLAKNNLYKDIQQASNLAYAALARYKASKKAVDAQTESFSYTKQKFDLGLVNSVDYNTAKNQLTKVESDMVQSKFDFVFRINILNFYRGMPFEL
ncbi:MAG: TolC family protein [Bacteroidales bacterium]|nr:TolC family protein [Bacteroidales bacterium]MBN2756131.1 TolC family protein [Bacteroidales bacterium]